VDTTKRRILVVANGTAEGASMHEAIRDRIRGRDAEVLVVASARNDGMSVGATEERLRRCLDLLGRAGIEANGVVGDPDPLQAIVDALHGFPADEVVLVDASNGQAGPWREPLA
jgi:hypothetical protein